MFPGTRIILATVTPKPGNLNTIMELYQGIIKFAEVNEPGCVEFQLFVAVNPESGVEELFTIERFKDMKSLTEHQAGPALVTFNEAVAKHDLLAKPVLVKVVKSVSGYAV